MQKTVELFDSITEKELTVRRIYVVANHIMTEKAAKEQIYEQLNFFEGFACEEEIAEKKEKNEKERAIQDTIIGIQNKYGRNAILKAHDFEEDATAIERNGSVGGHRG